MRVFKSVLALSFITTLVIPALAQEKPEKPETQDQAPPTFKIGTALVTVPVIVTDRYGRFVPGLSRGDFSIREDGAAQKIETFSSTEAPFNVALLIDTSRSTQNKLSAIRKAALAFIKQLQPKDRVMIVTFDEHVRFVSDMTNNPAELEKAIKSLKSSYLTSLYDAIYLTIADKLNKVQGRKAIVVLTDGVDTASKMATFESTLDLVANTGIIAYAIQYETRNDGGPIMKPIFLPNGSASSFISRFNGGAPTQSPPRPRSENETREQGQPLINLPRPSTSVLGSDANPSPSTGPGSRPSTTVNSQTRQPLRDRYLIAADFLRSLAVQSGARYIRAENIENTSFAFQLIAVELRNQYTLTYISNNEARDGTYRRIAVDIDRKDLVVRARLGYRSPRIEPTDSDQGKKGK